jgi:hypothetical protein
MKNAVTAALRACGKAAGLPANFLNHIAGARQFEGNCLYLANSGFLIPASEPRCLGVSPLREIKRN